MGNNELADNELADFATKEAQLVWNRYNCMLVANSIFLGFIGQSAIGRNTSSLGICACGIGLIIALAWLFLTSYAWSLSSYVFYKSKTPQKDAYVNWKKRMWGNRRKDPMWFFAHLVILVFCLAYFFLTIRFSKCCFWPALFLVALIMAFIYWYKKFVCFDEAKEEQETVNKSEQPGSAGQ